MTIENFYFTKKHKKIISVICSKTLVLSHKQLINPQKI